MGHSILIGRWKCLEAKTTGPIGVQVALARMREQRKQVIECDRGEVRREPLRQAFGVERCNGDALGAHQVTHQDAHRLVAYVDARQRHVAGRCGARLDERAIVVSETLHAAKLVIQWEVQGLVTQQTPVLLHPNEAAYALAGGLHKTTVDASAAMAWTQHRFEFNDTPLMDVLRQLAYWYDIDFETTDAVPAIHLNVTFSRDEPIDSVLNLLSQTKAFKYNRRGQHITLTF